MVVVGSMPIGLKLVTTTGSFKDKIIRAMYRDLITKLASNSFQKSIKQGMRPALEVALRAQPEYEDMVAQDGKLRAELGVVDSASAMDSLVEAWVKSVRVDLARPRIIGHRILGTVIIIRAIQADYQDVLNQAWASYKTEKDGITIPWLEWLLTKGHEILVAKHHIVHPRRPTARSRTMTNTIMGKTKGRGWGVPTKYAGTPENNYATRAVKAAMQDIEILVQRETQRRLR